MELSRLLRRVLFVAAVAVAGWLLTAVFAGAASADDAQPGDAISGQQAQKSSGLIGGLLDTLGGVTNKVLETPGTVVDTSGDVLAPIVQQPVLDLPAILPGSSSGGAASDRGDGLLDKLLPAPAEPPAPPPVVPPAPPVVAPPAPEPVAPPVIVVPATPVAPPTAQDTGNAATEHAGEGDPEPRPAKTPTMPAGSGTAVSTTHDNSGGARSTHGMLLEQATLHPAGAGFTTRGLARDATGRATGLPASSPD